MFRDDGSIQHGMYRAELAPIPRRPPHEETDGGEPASTRQQGRTLETRRREPAPTSGGWRITPLRRQETVQYDVEASYRRRPAKILPPQVPGCPLDQYPGEEPECADEDSPRVSRARFVRVRARAASESLSG